MASLGSDPRVRAGDEPGVWYVKNTESGQVETWRVGENYRLVSVLGCGSFGAVVKSFDARSSRFVALKLRAWMVAAQIARHAESGVVDRLVAAMMGEAGLRCELVELLA